MHRHVVAEGLGALHGAGGALEAAEQVGVQFGDAVELQGGGVSLEGQAAQYDGGKVAAVQRQARVAGQGRVAIVDSATKRRAFVGSGHAGDVPVCVD